MRVAFLARCSPLLILILAGCAGMESGECRTANWYEVGYRDAIFGMQRRDNVYAHQCSKHGVGLDAAAYGKGWQEGQWEADQRRGMSID